MARVQTNIAAAKLDTYWSQIWLAKSEVIGMSPVRDIMSHNSVVDLPSRQTDCPSLLDVLEVYLEQNNRQSSP